MNNKSEMTLKETVWYLRGCKAIFQDDVYCGMLTATAYIFQMDASELEKLIEVNWM